MIGMIRILAGISPGNMHFTRGEINHHGRNGVLPVKGINARDIMITDRVGQVDMILLDRLQGFDRMGGIFSQQTVGAEVADPRRDQFLGVIFDLFHDLGKIMIGMDHIPICPMQDVEPAGRNLYRIELPALMRQQMIISRGPVRNKHPSNGA